MDFIEALEEKGYIFITNDMGEVGIRELKDMNTYYGTNIKSVDDKEALDALELRLSEDSLTVDRLPKVDKKEIDNHKDDIVEVEDIPTETITVPETDNANARDMQKYYMEHHFEYFVPVFAVIMVLLCFSVIGGILWIPNTIDETISVSILELCKNILILIVGFYFGSSAGSKFKDKTIANK